MSRTLGQRHLAEALTFERNARALAATDHPADMRAAYAMTPAGRRQLRGIPCVGTGGLDERRNPLLEVLDREAERERSFLAEPWADA